MYWTNGSGAIELNITKKIASACYHQGQCDEDVKGCMELPEIKRQLNKLNPIELIRALKDYGAWDESELQNHEENKMRILWIAAGDIMDGNI